MSSDYHSQSEDRYRNICEDAPICIFQSTIGGKLLSINTAGAKMFGYETPAEAVETLSDTAAMLFVHPEQRADIVQKALESNGYVRCESEYRRRGGQTFIANLYMKAVRKDGQVVLVEGFIEDITESKEAEKAILDRQARIDSIFRAAPIGIGMVIDRVLTEVNDRICEMIGYSREELIGQNAKILYPTQEDYDAVGIAKYKQIAEHGTGTIETHMLHKDGTIIDVLLSSTPIDRNDLSQGVTFTMLDITESKRAEVALKESEEKYKDLVETTETGYLIVDAQGKVVDANAEYVRLTGHNNLEDILGRTVLDWTANYDLERNAEEVRKCAETGIVRDLEIDYVSPDGKKITPIEINATVIDTRQGPMILTLCRDITERKRAEAEKRQFYRDTILSVTDGKLHICDNDDIVPYLRKAQVSIDLAGSDDMVEARKAAKIICGNAGISERSMDEFIIATGEAITNAIKHGTDARMYAGTGDGTVWVGVTDNGTGIDSLILPKAILRRGFSTKPSLGLGYSIMLEVADQLLLSTDSTGTRVVLVKNIKDKPPMPIGIIVDTWEGIEILG